MTPSRPLCPRTRWTPRVAFRASRWGRGEGADYLNLPLDKEAYEAFVEALRTAEKVTPHAFEEARYFEGCLPIEVMAERGLEVLAHGPMKPVGLVNPATGKRAHAVVQLRQEDAGGTAYNLVGFQTRLTWPEQRRLFRTLPGLQEAEFLRLGQIHRNTYIDAPRLLDADLSLRSEPRLFFAGQITGVEGYVESAACGYLVALSVQARLEGRTFQPPPAATALGALYRHVTGEAHPVGHPAYAHQRHLQPLSAAAGARAPRQQATAVPGACHAGASAVAAGDGKRPGGLARHGRRPPGAHLEGRRMRQGPWAFCAAAALGAGLPEVSARDSGRAGGGRAGAAAGGRRRGGPPRQ